jgi:hypothetical protein
MTDRARSSPRSTSRLASNRQVLHLLHYIPERRGLDFDIIEDVIPLYDVGVSLRVDQDVAGVTLVPQNMVVDFTVEEGRVDFTVPKIDGHQMVEIQHTTTD